MIYAIGDSYTYGDELADPNDAWPAQLSQLLQQPVINQGRSACGNTRIVKRAMDAVLNGSATTVILGWTEPCRIEFADEYGIYDMWAAKDRPGPGQNHRQVLSKYLTAYDAEEYYYVTWLRQVIMVQALCQLHHVHLVMFISCGAHELNKKYLKNHLDLVQHIDTKNFIGWPLESMQSLTFHLPRGPGGHSLKEGHGFISNEITKYLRP